MILKTYKKGGKCTTTIIAILYVVRESKGLAQGHRIHYLWLQTFSPGLLSF